MGGKAIAGLVVLVLIVVGGVWLAVGGGRSEVADESDVVAPADGVPTASAPAVQNSGSAVDRAPAAAPTQAAAVVEQEAVSEPVVLTPDFSLQTPGGETITLSDYRGDKPVILDFWASWCPNCQRDMPKLSGWYQQYGDDVAVIGVNLQESSKVAQRFVDQKGIVFPIVMDPRAEASRAFGVTYTNYHVLINKDGSLAKNIPGDISEADILGLIRANSS